MKKLVNIFMGISLLWGFSMMAIAANTTITVSKKNPEFSIRVKSNPTTGFQWRVKQIDDKILEFSGKKYIKSRSKLIGSGGETVMKFKLKKNKKYPASTQLILFYSQQWNPNKGTLKKYTVVIE